MKKNKKSRKDTLKFSPTSKKNQKTIEAIFGQLGVITEILMEKYPDVPIEMIAFTYFSKMMIANFGPEFYLGMVNDLPLLLKKK